MGKTRNSSSRNSHASSNRTNSRVSVNSNNSRISTRKARGERLRVVKAVQQSRSIKPERDMSYHTGRPVMVGGRGQGTGLFAQPKMARRPSTESKKHSIQNTT